MVWSGDAPSCWASEVAFRGLNWWERRIVCRSVFYFEGRLGIWHAREVVSVIVISLVLCFDLDCLSYSSCCVCVVFELKRYA